MRKPNSTLLYTLYSVYLIFIYFLIIAELSLTIIGISEEDLGDGVLIDNNIKLLIETINENMKIRIV